MSARRRRGGATDGPDQAAAAGRLPSVVQREIVTRLASFETPTEVQTAVRELYQREVPLPTIMYYDASKASPELAEEWRALFRATRERVVKEEGDIGVAHRAVRLRRLETMVTAAMRRGSHGLAGKLLEQAAKEVGDAFTNLRVLQLGDPAEQLARLVGMTPDEIRALPPAPPAVSTADGG